MRKRYLLVRLFGKKLLEGRIEEEKIKKKIDSIVKNLKEGRVKVEEYYNPIPAYKSATMPVRLIEKEINGNAWEIVKDAFKEIAKKENLPYLAEVESIPFWVTAKQFRNDILVRMKAVARHPLLDSKRFFYVEIKGIESK